MYYLNSFYIRKYAAFVVLSLMLVFSQKVFSAEGTIPGIIVNHSGATIDVYVVLPDGASELIDSIEPGQQKSQKFYLNEVVLVTPKNSDDVIQQFTHDGTINQVFVINSEVVAAPTATEDKKPCPKDKVNCEMLSANDETPKEAAVPKSPEFMEWLKTDTFIYNERPPNPSEYGSGFQDKFRVEAPSRGGYHILKMDPSDLTERGLRGNPPDLLQRLEYASKDWHLGAVGLAIPNDLEVFHMKARSNAREFSTVYFSSNEERKSSSLNIGLGGSGGKSTGGKVSDKIGIQREDKKFQSKDETMIVKQKFGQAYWVMYVKEHMKLSKRLIALLSDENNLKSYQDFVNFFDDYGTHWPIGTLYGGYARQIDYITAETYSQLVSKSLSLSRDASIPLKGGATLDYSVGSTSTDSKSAEERKNSSSSDFQSAGGAIGADYNMWAMQDLNAADSYVPVKLELRAIYELIWPELMGISDPAEASRINQLRGTMAQMLARYIEEAQNATGRDGDDWKPKMYEVEIEKVVVSQDDDEGRNNNPDFYGKLSVFEALGKTPIANTGRDLFLPSGNLAVVWEKSRDKAVTKGKLSTFDLKKEPFFITVRPKAKVAYKVNGKPVYEPVFDFKDKYAVFTSQVKDRDRKDGYDDLSGQLAISLAEVEKSPHKSVSKEVEFESNDVGIKVRGSVKLKDYKFETDEFELLEVPHLRRRGEGDKIAADMSQSAKGVHFFDFEGFRPESGKSGGENVEQACYYKIQGKVAWTTKSTKGNTVWLPKNIKRLCSGIKSMSVLNERIGCFKTQMPSAGWENAIKQCGGR